MSDRFVNPYAFVPLPAGVERHPWLGHVASGTTERYSGTITATWTLKTPFLLPQNAKDEGWLGDDQILRIPGSAIKGAVRSLHEAMFNGCLRVVDEAFTPAYRAPAVGFANPEDWRLAMVTASDEGIPTQFQLTKADSTLWLESGTLRQKWPGGKLPTSGDIARIDGPRTDTKLGRIEIRGVSSVEVLRRAEDNSAQARADRASREPLPVGRIFLVTDTAARKVTRDDKSAADCYWASGELSEDVVDFNHNGQDAAAWAAFSAACRGTNDRRLLEQPSKRRDTGGDSQVWRHRSTYVNVSWPPQRPGSTGPVNVKARRAQQSGFLFRGDVVWVRYCGDRIEEIRLAQIWREPGCGPVRDRIGDAGPCPRVEDRKPTLCLSCVTFGSATTDGRHGKGDQTSYAGHVRFSTAVSTKAVSTRNINNLTPMGTPNPGSGAFYLRMPSTLSAELEEGDVPSHWGVAEQSSPIGGRKFYWHTDPDAQAKHWAQANRAMPPHPRYQDLNRNRPSKMSRPATLANPGTKITATIGVDQLDEVGVDALLAALDPKRLLHLTRHHQSHQPTYAVHLGGGKPFGLGSATVHLQVNLKSSRGRYTLVHPKTLTWPEPGQEPECMRLGAIQDRVGNVSSNLEALAVLLDLTGLGDLKFFVTYPPGASWSDFGSQRFRQSYEFFQQTNGQQLSGSRRKWLTLPQVGPGQDQSLPVQLKPRKQRGRR